MKSVVILDRKNAEYVDLILRRIEKATLGLRDAEQYLKLG